MFTLAKLISLALGITVVGSAGGIIVPIVLGFKNSFFERNDSEWDKNLSELITTEKTLGQQLSTQKSRYSSALDWLQKFRGIKFSKIVETFTTLFQTEQNIESQYKQAQEKFQSLLKLVEEKGKEIVKKLQAEKAKETLEKLTQGLTSLDQGLNSWKEGFQKIICALNNEKGECSGNSSGRVGRSATQPSSPSGGDKVSGSQKAQQSLDEVKQELEKQIGEISEMQSVSKRAQERVQTMSTYQKALSASAEMLLNSMELKETWLQKEIKTISEEIQKLFNKVQQLTQEITTISRTIELLKKTINLVKNYEGKLLNSLCGLHTVDSPECKVTKK